MATINQVVRESLEEFNASIVKTLQEKGIDSSGDASNSLEIRESGYVFSSWGIFYIEYLDRGRAPGKQPPLEAIERWIEEKGIIASAFQIAKGIAQRGTRIYRNRSLGLMLEDKVKVLQEDINKKIIIFANNEIKAQFNKALRGH